MEVTYAYAYFFRILSTIKMKFGQIWSCTNTHCDVTDFVNHGMVKNTKT